jgi:predicted RNA binding protein YcfA (HicA-like mRNA interferase family)
MPVSSRDIIRRLEKAGWVKITQKGSHTQWKHPDRPGRVTVPHPRRTLAAGTLKSICRQAGWDKL